MGNGFIVEITNKTNEPQEIQLFSGTIPNGVSVQTMDNRYQFDSLQMAAKVNPFKGNTLTTNSERAIEIAIVNKGNVEKIILNSRIEGASIMIDGQSDYLKLTCTPNSKFYLRLNTF